MRTPVTCLAIALGLAVVDPALAGAKAPRLRRLAAITPPAALSFGPWTMKVTSRRLLVLGTHVSSRTLVAYDRATWKLAWRYPGKAEGFVLRGGLVIVRDLKQKVVAVDLATGKRRWSVKGYLTFYQRRPLHPEAVTRDSKLLVTTGRGHALVDVSTGRVVLRAPKILAIPRYRRGTIGQSGYAYRRAPRTSLVPKGARLLALLQREARTGAVEGIYAWSLQGRRFTLTRRDKELKVQSRVGWTMPKLAGSDAFNGAPEPNKLATEVTVIGGQLLLYENYVTYRWSWNRGVNRLTGVTLPRGTLAFQLWGQRDIGKAGGKAPKYQGFVLRPGRVFVTTGSTLHWQQRAPLVSRLRLSGPLTPARAIVGASHLVPLGTCQLLMSLAPGRRLCLVLNRRQVAPKRYRSAITLRLLRGDKLSAPTRRDFGAWDPDEFHSDGGLLLIPSLRRNDRKRCKLEVFSLQP